MENLTQQQIEELIQFIDEAEEPATITNTIIAAVLAFLAVKIAGTATAQALLAEIAARQTADTNLSTSITQLQQLIQSLGSVVYLDSMGEELDGTPVHIDPGMVIYDPDLSTIKKCTAQDDYETIGCNENVLYCNKVTNILYRWSTRSLNMIQVGAAKIKVINNLTEGGEDDALSAEMGKELKRMIEESQSRHIDIVDDIECDAASSAISIPSARMVKEIYLNLKALFDPQSGLANLAFVGKRPDWKTVAKRQYTLTFGTFSGLNSTTPVKDAEGNAVTSGTQVNEGYLKLILVPQSAGHVFTSITINGEQVTSTPTGDADGSRYIEITVAGPITLAASAVSGRAVIFTGSTGCTIDATSVQAGQSLDTTIRANKYYNLPRSIIVRLSGTSTNVAHTYTPAQDGKTARLQVASADITGNLEVVCIASKQTPITVSLNGTHVTFMHGDDVLGSSASIYPDDMPYTINVKPAANGYVIDAAPTATGCTVESDNAGGYNVKIHTGTTTNVTIQASASANFWEVNVPSNVQHLTITDENDTAFASNVVQVTKGSAFTCYIKAETLWKVNVVVTMGGEPVANAYTPSTGRVYIEQVTGDVIITATAVEDNPAYKNVRFVTADVGYCKMQAYYAEGFVSKLIPVDGISKIYYKSGDYSTADTSSSIIAFDENLNILGMYTQRYNPRDYTLPAGCKYICFAFKAKAKAETAIIWTDDENNPIWTYSQNEYDNADGAMDFVERFINPEADANGNIPAIFVNQDWHAELLVVFGQNASSQYPTNVLTSKDIELPAAVDGMRTISYWGGETTPSWANVPLLIAYNNEGNIRYCSASSSTEQGKVFSDISETYTHCRLVFHADKYYDNENYQMFIKDGNGNVLWDNTNIVKPDVVDEESDGND